MGKSTKSQAKRDEESSCVSWPPLGTLQDNKPRKRTHEEADVIRPQRSISMDHVSKRPTSEERRGPFKRQKSPSADKAGRISDAVETALKKLHVMVNLSDVPLCIAHSLELFHLFDGTQYVVGFCLPLHVYRDSFGEPSKARTVKEEEASDKFINDYKWRYKFHYVPLKTVPEYETEFNAMAASPYAPNKSNSVRGNEFFICSDESADKQQRDGRMNAGTTSKSIADGKFKMELNPHLTPFRYPDGLRCYMRLDLAEYCQHALQPWEMENFVLNGAYHVSDVAANSKNKPAHQVLPPPPPHSVCPPPPLAPLVRKVDRTVRPSSPHGPSKHQSKTRNSPSQKHTVEQRGDKGRQTQKKAQDLRNEPWRRQ